MSQPHSQVPSPSCLSLARAPQGRVGENPGNEVVGELDRNFYSVVGKVLNSSLLSGIFGQLDCQMVKEMS